MQPSQKEGFKAVAVTKVGVWPMEIRGVAATKVGVQWWGQYRCNCHESRSLKVWPSQKLGCSQWKVLVRPS